MNKNVLALKLTGFIQIKSIHQMVSGKKEGIVVRNLKSAGKVWIVIYVVFSTRDLGISPTVRQFIPDSKLFMLMQQYLHLRSLLSHHQLIQVCIFLLQL